MHALRHYSPVKCNNLIDIQPFFYYPIVYFSFINIFAKC